MDISLAIPECRVARFVEQHEDHLIIPVRLDAASGRCPDCGQASRSVHSRYHRQPADLPVSASQTRLCIEVRRFFRSANCLNPACRRRTFAEAPMTLLAPRARRTRRLGEAQARVGLACGGAGGARLLTHLHMPASRATVLRLVTRMPMPDAPAPIRVGIDNWAIRKGRRYGTIVVDLDRHRVIDLLPDRTAPTVAGWLERHPGVELVARDRLTEYARVASLGAPQA
ncbi:ISL3 family transposase [Methylobacterium aquaticum]|uniref:ISL3 family transposase n=1 Tax=Methylobacterium aquaticum TaxID=270351 RepID=UPI000A59D5C0